MFRKFQGEPLKPAPRLCVLSGFLPHDLATGGIPHPGSRHLTFFFFSVVFIYLFFTLQYCIGFVIHWHESAMGVHVFPILNPASYLPPCTISLGHPSAPAPSILYPVSNLDWWFISCMIVYMFQCHSPKSSHPLPLPQSPKDCSIRLCLFCCLAYRVIVIIFLHSIYTC